MTHAASGPEPGTTPATHGNRFTLLTQLVRVACKLLSVAVVARLVTPADHGLYAMAASVTLFLFLFLELGLGTAVVQATTLTERHYSPLWRLHVRLGLGLMLVTLALAPVAARFYARPALVPLLAVMSAGFLLNALGGLPRALLNRSLDFRALNRLETSAALAGTFAMITAAVLGAGAYTFAVFLLVSEGVSSVLAWRLSSWRPATANDPADIRDIVRTARHIVSYHLLNYFVQQLDTLVVGRQFGARTLGLYNRASQMLGLPLLHIAGPLSRVALAVLARLPPASPEFVRQCLASANLIAHLTLPLAAFVIATPDDTVRLVLGSQWPEAAPMLRWLAVAAAANQITYLAFGVCVAAGRSRRLVALAAASIPVVTLAAIAGMPYGPVGIAAAMAAAAVVLALIRLWWSLRDSAVTLMAYLRGLAGPLAMAVAFGAGARLGRLAFGDHGWQLHLFGAFAGAVVGAAAALLFFPRLRREWSEVLTHLPALRSTIPPSS